MTSNNKILLILAGAVIGIAGYFFSRPATNAAPDASKVQASEAAKPTPPVSQPSPSPSPVSTASPKISPKATKPVLNIADEIYKRRQDEIQAMAVIEQQKKDLRPVRELFADVTTDMGRFTIRLQPEIAPRTVDNFVGLSEGTVKSKDPDSPGKSYRRFYDGVIFHRVVKGYFIQTGAPYRGGRGDPGFMIPDEFNTRGADIEPGMVVMAQSGKGTAGSQFFIALSSDMRGILDDNNTVFGRVIDGMSVLRKIGQTKTDVFERPVQDIFIRSIKIRRIYGKAPLRAARKATIVKPTFTPEPSRAPWVAPEISPIKPAEAGAPEQAQSQIQTPPPPAAQQPQTPQLPQPPTQAPPAQGLGSPEYNQRALGH